ERAWKSNGCKGVLALGPHNLYHGIFVEHAGGQVIQVPAEKRLTSGAAFGIHNEDGAASRFADVRPGVSDNPQISVETGVLAKRLKLLEMVGRELRQHRRADDFQ